MNPKITGIIPLIVVMLFIVAFAIVDNGVAAVSGSSSSQQTVTVTVKSSTPNNNPNNTNDNTGNNVHDNNGNIQDDIALNVIPTTSSMTRESSTNTNYFTAYSGSSPNDNNIHVKNLGTVPINVFIRSASTQFLDGSTNSFIPTIFIINSQDGSHVNIFTVNSYIATNMPVNGIGSNFKTHITLGMPLSTLTTNNYQNQLIYTTIEYM